MNSFISFFYEGNECIGCISEDKTYLLDYRDMAECITSGFDTSGKKEIKTATLLKLRAPLTPPKIICLGWNYAEHNKELKASDNKPVIFLKPPTSVIGPNEAIILPKISKQVEHEIELGIVIGKKGKHIDAEEALEYVAGYTIILDITARDLQNEARKKGDPWDICKGLDTFAPIGPCIVPKEYVQEPGNLAMELKVNGNTRQKTNTREMIKKPPEIVSYISGYMTLQAGDVIASGTPSGVGPIKHGDVIDSEIEKIGSMRNHAVNE
jgi:2-keto-4-pentenoate hydratase/2-oxohepta-3-ene-1,7-dioic acid hydratase in catechol pathway